MAGRYDQNEVFIMNPEDPFKAAWAQHRLLKADLPDAAECAKEHFLVCNGTMFDGTKCPYVEICFGEKKILRSI